MQKIKVAMLDLISKVFDHIDHVLVPGVPHERWRNFVQSIEPVNNGFNLIRVGPDSEGSYLLPDDLDGIRLNISPGVGETWQFESALLNSFNIPSLMIDASVDKPDNLPKEIEFLNHFLVPISGSNSGVSISELVSQAALKYGEDADLLLQMDIEGAEFDCLKWVEERDLDKFRILAIEFHDMELWVQNSFFTRTIEPVFERLLERFDVVHSRANNHARTFFYKGYFIPSALELTFHRKDRFKGPREARHLPTELDIVNKQFTSQRTPFEKK